MDRSRPRKVYLVGAGPGDPLLLTLRALEVIREADVVIYDRLVSQGVLGLIPGSVRRIYGGKAPGAGGSAQRRLNQLILEEARPGRKVVRLKGGDPFLFSRGGEEAEFLMRRGVEIEVIPGVTSALGAPAYAGIPLTRRNYASSVAIVTGHYSLSKSKDGRNWPEKLAGGVDTIVILMGVSKLSEISRRLMRAGLAPSTPVAAIVWGTTKKQKTLMLTLLEASSGYHAGKIEPPTVIVVGKVASLATKLGWYHGGKLSMSPDYLSTYGNFEPQPRSKRS